MQSAQKTESTPDSPVVKLRSTVEVDASQPQGAAMTVDAAAKLAEELKEFQNLAVQVRKKLNPNASYQDRCDQAFSLANDLFGHAPTWVCFFREVFSIEGLAHRLFPVPEEHAKFLTSNHYDQLQQMLTALRSRELPENDPNDPQRMITVRLPRSLHEALCDEARRLKISVNKLCISRLLQVLDQKMIPEVGSRPRGRKPRTAADARK